MIRAILAATLLEAITGGAFAAPAAAPAGPLETGKALLAGATDRFFDESADAATVA